MTNEELERAVTMVTDQLEDAARYESNSASINIAALRALLSERAELLAAVERMRGALEGINELARDRLALIPPDLVRGGVVGELLLEILARAALTTGEEK